MTRINRMLERLEDRAECHLDPDGRTIVLTGRGQVLARLYVDGVKWVCKDARVETADDALALAQMSAWWYNTMTVWQMGLDR